MNRFACSLLIVLLASSLRAADQSPLAQKGYAVLQTYCLRCHGDELKHEGLDLRDRPTLLKPRDPDERPFLVPGKLTESRLWVELERKRMPPEKQPQPTEAERDLLRRWIEAGAEFPVAERPKRDFIGERTLLKLIADDLEKQPDAKRASLRYFSLAHLWNDLDTSDEQLWILRAAVSKLINSLSSQPRIAPPQPVDRDGVVLRINLQDYGWKNSKQWLSLLKAYPYGLQVSSPEAQRVYELTDCDLPYLRADWFVFQAARPPLFHDLVTLPDALPGLPTKVAVLERLLGVDVQENYRNDRLWRAGFSKSGVSDHNRMVERHDAKFGYYWPSYDFKGDSDRQNLPRFPLGPKFPNSQNLGAFEHDGGEFIFSLPNGLQGYMLATADGNRIDAGPQEIVRDPQAFSGSFTIVNGISCMGCHRNGMIKFTDTIRPQYLNQTGEIASKVLRLYSDKKVMDELLKRDSERFLKALEATIGPFLRTGPTDDRKIEDFVEPITAAAKQYARPRKLADVARDLGLPDDEATAQSNGIKATSADLAKLIEFSDLMRRLELTPLAQNETITQQQWEKAFQRAARELGLGTPLDVQ